MLILAGWLKAFTQALPSRTLIFSAMFLLLLAVGCSSGSDDPIISSDQEAGGPDYSVIIITTDMAVGHNRIVFGVIDRDGMPVRGDTSEMAAYFLVPREETREFKGSVEAEYLSWPTAVGGVFVAEVDLETVGAYEMDVNFTSQNGASIFAQGSFILKETPGTPAIGAPAPASVTHTSANTYDISHITSSLNPDPDLYEFSIHEALRQGKPLVVVFATPAFCISATCGPQVEVISQVKERFQDQANFIHVEVFKDPHLVQGGRPVGGTVAAMDEWNLPTEPWTFVVDEQGRVRAKFEQFTVAEEIEAALAEVLAGG